MFGEAILGGAPLLAQPQTVALVYADGAAHVEVDGEASDAGEVAINPRVSRRVSASAANRILSPAARSTAWSTRSASPAASSRPPAASRHARSAGAPDADRGESPRCLSGGPPPPPATRTAELGIVLDQGTTGWRRHRLSANHGHGVSGGR